MARLAEEIRSFLAENGLDASVRMDGEYELVSIRMPESVILPIEITSRTLEEAQADSLKTENLLARMRHEGRGYPLIITEDRWRRNPEAMKKRLLAHLMRHSQVYARNCEVRRIEKKEAEEFLAGHHSYAGARCRYHYGMFLKRHTGHNATDGTCLPAPGALVAVAQFSNARRWTKGDKVISSYEWTRYASMSGIRVSGGMGRMLDRFIRDVGPDDIMSYADLEWSEGAVYEQLGFKLEGRKEPVVFVVDEQWRRFPVKPGMTEDGKTGRRFPVKPGMTEDGMTGRRFPVKPGMTEDGDFKAAEGGFREEGLRFFRNFGSNKYRLKLTDYE
ncbi:MAG: hypothetical protein E7112_01195 [Bacteroidales bacterium]|nr:hypothetical protein [Bacteroidales bacterium]